MSHFSLRPYQQDCLHHILQAMKVDKDVLVKAPCAFGKTQVFVELAKNFPGKILVLLNRVILVEQTKKRFIDSGQSCGIVCGSLGENDSSKRVTIATIQTIKEDVNSFNLIIIDEWHQSISLAYTNFLLGYTGHTAGFTATPFNSSGYLYGSNRKIKELTYDMSMNELIELGFLTPLSFKQVNDAFEVGELKTLMGDYRLDDLETLAKDEIKLKSQVRDALSRMNGRKKVVWVCVSIEHAERICSELVYIGEKALSVHSGFSKQKQDENMKRFENEDTRHMVSVTMITTGYDFSAIDCIVMLRPTKSPDMFVQIAGRAMRLYPEKSDALFLDFGHVVENLGHPNDPLVKGFGAKKKDDSQVKEICPACFELLFSRKKECVKCGHVFVREKVVVDKTKNLTERAWHPDEDLIKTVGVADWNIDQNYISKSGGVCIRVTYRGVLGTTVHVEYFNKAQKWSVDRFTSETECFRKMPIRLLLKKEPYSKYWRTVKREYF